MAKTAKTTNAKPKVITPKYSPILLAMADTMVKITKRVWADVARVKIQKEQEPKLTAKATALAKIIQGSDFGCQKANVAKLMQVATGEPVVNAYNKERGIQVAPDLGLPKKMRKAGAVFVLTKPMGWRKEGTVGFVWSDETTSLRVGGKAMDIMNATLSPDTVRMATREEILALLERDKTYFTHRMMPRLIKL